MSRERIRERSYYGDGFDVEELSETQETELKTKLLVLEIELARLAEEGAQSETVSLDESIGRLSRMDAMQHQKMAKQGTDAHKRRLLQVQQALTAIENDSYGYCRECEEPTGYKRLKARPEAPFCLECQSHQEGR